MDAVVYVHGKGGSAVESEHYKTLFPQCEVIGIDYKAATPWEVKNEFKAVFQDMSGKYNSAILIANSIGAFFSMNSGIADAVTRAFFISPVVNMEKLITDMMGWAGISEKELEEKGIIPTEFGENLSWEYLSYVREHPIRWTVPTEILYGSGDNITSLETMKEFAKAHHSGLTVMKGGEHWFHTEEQMRFLDAWIQKNQYYYERR